MIGRILLIVAAVVALGLGAAYVTGQFPFAETGEVKAGNTAPAGSAEANLNADVPPQPVDVGKDLYAASAPANASPAAPAKKFGLGADPIVIGDCVLNVGEQAKQDVPAQRDGVILFIGTDVSDEEWAKLPQERRVERTVAGKPRKFRMLREDDPVAVGQLLAVVDDRVAYDEYESKKAKVQAAEADREASVAIANEAKAQWETAKKLHASGRAAAPQEEVNTKYATYVRYQAEVTTKAKAIEQAQKEANQAATILGQYEIRSSIPGVIKTIFKTPGEAVKSSPSYEPVFQVMNLKKLRAEGLVEEQHLPSLRKGMKVAIERSLPQKPMQTLSGHFQEVTSVAVARGDNPRIVSGSRDGTVRVWDRGTGREVRVLKHPTEVRAVACSPEGSKENLCLSGGPDGLGRLWKLDDDSKKPVRTLSVKHRGGINAVAFSPDGAFCATGGEDREICVWDTATGELKYRLVGHTGALTSLQFAPDSQLVSAAKDGTLRLWKLGADAGRLEITSPRRSGEVSQLGISPDGKYVLFDPYQSKELRVLSLPEGLTEGRLRNPTSSAQFNTLAKFSPDGRTILTAGSGGDRLQLWRSPLGTGRAYVLRQLESEERSQPTCGAFSPDGKFVVAGTKDKNVLVWPTPDKKEIDQLRTATIVYIDPTIDTSSHQTRIWAELDDAEGFTPGATVTVVRYPEK